MCTDSIDFIKSLWLLSHGIISYRLYVSIGAVFDISLWFAQKWPCIFNLKWALFRKRYLLLAIFKTSCIVTYQICMYKVVHLFIFNFICSFSCNPYSHCQLFHTTDYFIFYEITVILIIIKNNSCCHPFLLIIQQKLNV